jgi:VanZ family protein
MLRKNLFSILLASIIMYLSLANSHTFDKVSFSNIPNFDKFVHFLMYFSLMSVIIFENRRTLNSLELLFLVSLIPFLYGILMEILQLTLTLSRTGSILDVIANSAGILVSLLLWIWIKPLPKETFR